MPLNSPLNGKLAVIYFNYFFFFLHRRKLLDSFSSQHYNKSFSHLVVRVRILSGKLSAYSSVFERSPAWNKLSPQMSRPGRQRPICCHPRVRHAMQRHETSAGSKSDNSGDIVCLALELGLPTTSRKGAEIPLCEWFTISQF